MPVLGAVFQILKTIRLTSRFLPFLLSAGPPAPLRIYSYSLVWLGLYRQS